MLLTGLFHHTHAQPTCSPNFLDTGDQRFSSFHNALDNALRELWLQGVGSETKEAQPFTKAEEEMLRGVWCAVNKEYEGIVACNFFFQMERTFVY